MVLAVARRHLSTRLLGQTLLALLTGALVLVPAPTASAHHQTRLATHFVVDSISTPSVELPDTPGTEGLVYVVKDTPFDVAVSFRDDAGWLAPLTTARHEHTAVTISVVSGPDQGLTWHRVVYDRATHAVFRGLRLPSAGNGVALKISTRYRDGDDAHMRAATSDAFDVLSKSASVSGTSALTGIGSGGATGVACSPTRSEQVCADLLLPNGVAKGDGLLGLGACDAVDECGGQSVQALIALRTTRQHPATLVMKCDKSLCAGGSLRSYRLNVNLRPSDAPALTQACPKKGTVGAGQLYCVDYVQSHLANAGDTYLYLLFVEDAKVRFP
jgi:hypothetical protein